MQCWGYVCKTDSPASYAEKKSNLLYNDKICRTRISNDSAVQNKEKSYITGNEQLDADYYIAYNGDNKLYIVGFKMPNDKNNRHIIDKKVIFNHRKLKNVKN